MKASQGTHVADLNRARDSDRNGTSALGEQRGKRAGGRAAITARARQLARAGYAAVSIGSAVTNFSGPM